MPSLRASIPTLTPVRPATPAFPRNRVIHPFRDPYTANSHLAEDAGGEVSGSMGRPTI